MMSGLQPGAVLDGRYRVISLLAEGGMASVYLATDLRLERSVAIKIVHSQLATGEHGDQFLRRFHSEVTSAAAIANPHIVQVYDTGTVDRLPYLVMEYVRGTDLRHEIGRQGTLSVRDTLRLLSQTLDGLAAAHQAGITHRDIKPENILLTTRGSVKIGDFGLAKAVSDRATGTTGLLLGTAAYLAPEMIQDGTASPASDIYAVGIMAYEMLTGSTPFQAANPVTTIFRHVNADVPSIREVDSGFPKLLADLVSQLCRRDPAQRPQDGRQALGLLNEVLGALTPAELSFRHAPRGANGISRQGGRASSVPGSLLHSSGPSAQSPRDTRVQPPAASRPPLPATAERAGRRSGAGGDVSVSGSDAFLGSGTEILDPGAAHRPAHLAAADVAAGRSLPSPAGAKGGRPVSSGPSAAGLAASLTPERESRKRHHPALIALIVALLTAMALVGGYWIWWRNLGPGSLVTIPTAAGRSCSVGAVPSSPFAEVASRISDRKSSETAGRSRQKPGQGGCSVAGTSWSSYRSVLDRRRISYQAKNEYSETVARGRIIDSAPLPGTRVSGRLAHVRVTVSKGPRPVSVPSVTGMTRGEARSALERVRLHVKEEQEYSDSVAEGSVIRQEPAASQQVTKGTTVTLIVSRGPQMVTMPNLIGSSRNDAVNRLRELGLEVKTQPSAIGELLHQVFSQSVPGGQRVRLRDSSGKATVITLTIV